jgi:hypothetical protein
MRATRFVLGALIIALVVLLLGGLALSNSMPAAAQASNQLTTDVLAATPITGTLDTAAPNLDSASRDASKTVGWTTADVFIAATVDSSATLTATVQVSPDGLNWADAKSEYWTGTAIGTHVQRRVMTVTGVEYVTFPLAGEYWRLHMVAAGGTVTPTVKVTLRR